MEVNLIKIKRALLSVTDKTGLDIIAKTLTKFGCEIISTGGTGEYLKKNNIPFTEISEVTGNPESLGGRMKTISFQIESALLFDRIKDKQEAEKLGIEPIDMVICNLYDFQKHYLAGLHKEDLIEQIDIGGPLMIRAGAKNYKYVAVVTSSVSYEDICKELEENSGSLSLSTRERLSAEAFNVTADYDSLIASALDKLNGNDSYRIAFNQGTELRYGENSHQPAMIFRERNVNNSILNVKVLNGIELSYNNVLDINAAIETVSKLKNKAAVVVKHNNPCGAAESSDLRKSLELAWNGDSVSAFGGIVALNSEVDLNTANFFGFDEQDKSKVKFIEIIAAPSYTSDALKYLSSKKNLRVIQFDAHNCLSPKDIRYVNGSLLVQEKDNLLYKKLECVTETKFDIENNTDLIEFGLKTISQIKSNAIALAGKSNDSMYLTGMGAGQPNRLNSTMLALEKDLANSSSFAASEKMLFSDAFFPFEDNVELINKYEIKTIIQPGGSIRDKKVIEKCNQFGIAMIFTGTRHFKH